MASRWLPQTPEALRAALDDGLLTEGHFFDVKEKFSPGPAGGRDLAIDIASFAVDGGVIVVGVRENKDLRTFELDPIRLAGLAERVDQVARARIDPAIQVTCLELLVGEGLGYLVISIPASPLAPHMVQGRYRGRSDTTNVVLTDAEVRRLHERAALFADRAVRLLGEEVARDPSPSGSSGAHLFVVAQPVTADPQLLLRHANGNVAQWARDAILDGPPCHGHGTAFDPDLGSTATQVSRRADGVAISTYEVGPGRIIRSASETGPVTDADLLDLEVREDGGLRLFCGRASAEIDVKRVAFEALIAGLTLRTILAAVEVCEATRYAGAWDLALAVTNLRGVYAYSLHNRFGMRFQDVPYSAQTYEQTIRVESDVMATAPLEVLESLYGRLHRGLSGGGVSLAELTQSIRS